MRAVFVLALLVCAALADFDFTWADGNLSDAAYTFEYRWGHCEKKTSPTVTGGYFHLPEKLFIWRSTSCDFDKADKDEKEDSNALVGAAYLFGSTFYPLAIVAYGTGKKAVDLKDKEFIEELCKGSMYEPFQNGALAIAAVSVGEYYPNGTFVDGTMLDFKYDCTPEEYKQGKGYMKAMSCSLIYNGKTTVTISYVASKIAGILKYGMTPVSPLSLDMIIEVQNFELTDKANHIGLTLGLIGPSGLGGKSENKNAWVITKKKEQVYAALSDFAMIRNTRTQIKYTIGSGSNPLTQNNNGLLKVAMGDNADYQAVTVEFPDGESSFIYDPALGANSIVYEAGASTVALSLLVLLACALLFLF